MATERNLPTYEDRYWWSRDGLRLHCREYSGRDDRPPLLCIPGLTRNARDFERLAQRLAGAWRVIVVDLRGRGDSAYAKDPMTYVPLTYLQDLEALLNELALERFIGVGTSLGGILTMLLAGPERERLVGAILNDIGPEIDTAGLHRIRGYLGRGSAHPTWMHAARAVADNNGALYPDYVIEDWLAMAKRIYRLNSNGRIVLDYDARIAEPFRVPGNEAGPDMWQAFETLQGKPVLIVRGELSDILSVATAERMAERMPGIEVVTVARTGHAPTLNEPEAVAGIDRFLAKLA